RRKPSSACSTQEQKHPEKAANRRDRRMKTAASTIPQQIMRGLGPWNMEGIMAKLARDMYTPEATTWVKIKNRAYSQAEGRVDFFDVRVAQVWWSRWAEKRSMKRWVVSGKPRFTIRRGRTWMPTCPVAADQAADRRARRRRKPGRARGAGVA